MLSGPHARFCDGVVRGLNATQAYLRAYPKCSEEAARRNGSRLLTKADVEAEIARMRRKAEEKSGSAVLTLAEKRKFLARVVRADLAAGDIDGDLLQSVDFERRQDGREIEKQRVCDKLGAIKLDNDMAGEGSEAEANGALAALMGRIRK